MRTEIKPQPGYFVFTCNCCHTEKHSTTVPTGWNKLSFLRKDYHGCAWGSDDIDLCEACSLEVLDFLRLLEQKKENQRKK